MSARAVVVLLPPAGFPGQALLSVLERLRERGVAVVVASRYPGRCAGTGGVTVSAVLAWDAPELAEAAAWLILDDAAGTLAADPGLARRLVEADGRGALLAAVGAGAFVLAEAGLLRGRVVAAGDDGVAERLRHLGAVPMMRVPRVLADRRILTATEAGAAAVADELDDFLRVGAGPAAPP